MSLAKRRLPLLFIFLLLFGIGAGPGCADLLMTGDDDDDNDNDSSSPTPTGSSTGTPEPSVEYGGYFQLGGYRYDYPGQPSTTLGIASASFWEPKIFEGGTGSNPTLDTCDVLTPDGPTPTPVPLVYRDVGSTVTMSGPTTVFLARAFNQGTIYYAPTPQPLAPEAVTAGGVYDVSWSGGPGLSAGSITDAIVVPQPVVMTQPTFLSTPMLSGALNVAWNGSTGSDSMWIYVTTVVDANNYATARCLVNDDGSFTVPSNIIAQLPSGSGNIGVLRLILNEPMLPDGSVATATGLWQHYGFITKP